MTPESELKPEADDKRFDIKLPDGLAQRVAALPEDARLTLAGELLPHLAKDDQAAVERLAERAVDKHERKQRREFARIRAMMSGGATAPKAIPKAKLDKRRAKAKAERKARKRARR